MVGLGGGPVLAQALTCLPAVRECGAAPALTLSLLCAIDGGR